MTDLIDAVITRLKSDTAICSSSYVGATPNQRIYRASFPKGPTFPCLVVKAVSGSRDNATHNKTTNKRARVQVTAFATGDDDAFALSELVATNLHGLDNTSLTGAFVIRSDDQGMVPDVNLTAGVYLYHRDFLFEYG